MRRAVTALVILCLLAVSAVGVTVRPVAAEVDVASLDPTALFEALSETAMSEVALPGSLRADDAEVVGYGDTYPSTGNVGINWPDDGVFINYFVFETLGSAAESYVASETATVVAGDSPDQADPSNRPTDYCRPSEASGGAESVSETCFTLRSNVIVASFGDVALDVAPALLQAAVEHLEIVAQGVADAGEADPGSSAAAQSTAEAEVAADVGDGAAATIDPSALLQALVTAEMSDVSLPGFLKSEDATVEPFADDDEAVADAVGGVTISWSGLDEGKVIGLVVYPDEAAAGAAYAAEEAAVEAALGIVPTFQTSDGLEGLCDFSMMASADESQPRTCYLLSGNVVVAGADDSRHDDASSLASAGALHLAYVSRSIVDGDAGTTGTPVAGSVDPGDPASLLDALESAEVGQAVELPGELSAEEAEVNELGPEYLEGDEVGAVSIVWGSDDPDRQVDALIYLYVYETDDEAEAAYLGDDEESGADKPRTFSVDAATASGTVEGLCVPVDVDEDGVDEYDFCATLSGNVLVVATDLTAANDGEALAVAGVEHVEAVRGG